MRNLYLLFLLLIFGEHTLIAQDDSCIDPAKIDLTISCPQFYDPVCGCDGMTYKNNCVAEFKAGVIYWQPGPCDFYCIDTSLIVDPPVGCPNVYDPVCGCDGVTYYNSCDAQSLHGVKSWTYGACIPLCIDTCRIEANPICSEIYNPVCGCDGTTYDNPCIAEKTSGITTWTRGACISICVDTCLIRDSWPCPLVWDPVCGCNGVTYANECDAKYHAGVKSWHKGMCQALCIDTFYIDETFPCPEIYDPVCGCDGVTYDNECFAKYYNGIKQWTMGKCLEDCIDTDLIDPNMDCPDVWDPVCGCDGITYSNECDATYHNGVSYWTEGVCCIDQDLIDPNMGCPDVWDPVCGCDGITYSNVCDAKYHNGVSTWTQGVCCLDPSLIDPNMGCPDVWDPVCGCDGVTYSNVCDAQYHNGVTKWTVGICCIDPAQIDPNMGCPDNWDPVCGCDGVTYSNECDAKYHNGVTSWTLGECYTYCIDPSIINPLVDCTDIWDPVCGCDGNTYSNLCQANQSGITRWTIGECIQLCIDTCLIDPLAICTTQWDPVCGCDGETYSNECIAQSSGVRYWSSGECQLMCIDTCLIDPNMGCDDVWDPVCGCDGVTYSNECDAKYHSGVKSWTKGVCVDLCIDTSFIDITIPCPLAFIPVCGCDGVTYGNACEAKYYYGVKRWQAGRCMQACIDPTQYDPLVLCNNDYDPVCGCDGNTYINRCLAYQSGVTSWEDGACHCQDTLYVEAPIYSGIYESLNLTHSDQLIGSGKTVEFQSQQDVQLNPGFEVEQGATFLAHKDVCDAYGWSIGDITGQHLESINIYTTSPDAVLKFWLRKDISLCPNQAVKIEIRNVTTNMIMYSQIHEIADINGVLLTPFMEEFQITNASHINIITESINSSLPPNQQILCFTAGNIKFAIEY